MKLYIRKTTGEVAMYSNEPLSVDPRIFDVVDYSPAPSELAKLQNNMPARYKGSSLAFDATTTERDAKAGAVHAEREALIATIQNPLALMDVRFQAVIDLVRTIYED